MCSTGHGSVILVDVSSYSNSGIMDQQYQFLLNNFLPRYYVQNNQNILSYGDGSSLVQNFLTDHADACQVTQAKYDYGLEHSGQRVYLANTVQSIFSRYAQFGEIFMFFTATRNTTDVMNTYFAPINGGEVGVVDWSGSQMWRSRKNRGDINFLMEVYSSSNMEEMSRCLGLFACSLTREAQTCADAMYTTKAPSTTFAPSTEAVSVPTSAPSIVNPLALEPQCECVSGTVWVDIMIAYDSSINAAATIRPFREITSVVNSEIGYLNIETSASVAKYHTRAGIISYGNEAHLDSYLGQYNDADFETQEVTYTQDPKTNISDALRLAMDQFNTKNHRQNARPVIVLVANTFTNGEASPLAQATAFKKSGGIIVVYYFNPIGTQYNLDILHQLASPGYFIYNNNEPDEGDSLLVTAMCDANCFCPDGYVTPMVDPTRLYPIAGCHTASIRKANEVIAQTNCQMQYNGSISTAKYKEKSQYLESLIGPGNKFWLGLTYDKFSQSYFWVDGPPLNISATAWNPFTNAQTSTAQNCVYEVNMAWTPVENKPSYFYLCETAPCSSKMYCDPAN